MQAGLKTRLYVDHHGGAHASAHAECSYASSTAAGAKCVDERGQNARAARANRMSERNRSASHIDFGQIEIEFASDRQRL